MYRVSIGENGRVESRSSQSHRRPSKPNTRDRANPGGHCACAKLNLLGGYARVQVEGQVDRVTAAAAQSIGAPGRKVRAPLGRVLGNAQASAAATLPQGTESGTETYRPDLSG